MKSNFNRIVVIAGIAFLSACSGNVKENLGLKKDAPDEFRVISKPPLSIPPNFNLRPPHEGGASLPQSTVREEAKDILFSPERGNGINSEAGNRGEDLLLNKVGAERADPNIRSVLRKEQQTTSPEEEEKKGFFRNLLSRKPEEKPDPVVNARKESERIKENIKNNEPVTKGETPTVKQGNKGILQKIFSSDSE